MPYVMGQMTVTVARTVASDAEALQITAARDQSCCFFPSYRFLLPAAWDFFLFFCFGST